MNTKKYTFKLLFLFSYLIVFPQKWVAINNSKLVENPTVEIISSNTKELTLKVTVSGFFREEIISESIKYDNIYFPNKQSLNEVGFPALPVLNELIALPKNSSFEISIIDSSWVILDDYLIFPFQTPLLESEKSRTFDIDEAFYASFNQSYPMTSYKHSEIMNWKGIENFNLTICPIKYFPENKQIYALRDFTIKIKFKQTGPKFQLITNSITEKHNMELKQNMLNWDKEMLKNYYPDSKIEMTEDGNSVQKSILSANDYKYLIISSPAYVNSVPLMKFKDWKSRIGLKCKIVTTSTTGTTPASIKSYIFTEYSNSGIEYVLFVGDHSDIPLYTWSTTPSDYWYGCVVPSGDNDYQAEVAIGRFSISSLSDLENMVNKSISYEKNPPLDNWVEKSLLIAHKELAPDKYQGCKEDIRAHSYSVTSPNFIQAYGAYPSEGGNSATNQTVIDYINAGIGLINYRGHGSTTSWDGAWSYEYKSFNASEIAKLTNKTKTPVILSIACNNGEINSSNICLLESFTRGTNGSVAFLGATIPTYTTVNHYFDKELYRQIYNLATYTIGDLLIQSNIQTMLYYSNSSTSKSNVRSYLWGGDPALELWDQTPALFNNVSITDNGNNITVNTGGVSNCTIIVSSTLDDGMAYHSIAENVSSYTFTSVIRPYYVTVKKHNYIPYLSDTYIQNKNLTNNAYISGKNIYAGSNVTTKEQSGQVSITNGANIYFDASNETLFDGIFEVELGSEFEIVYP
jgi:uncharacterized pyridoxamine 5'-phosphate oxidase family protein